MLVWNRVGNGLTRKVENFKPSSEFPVKGDSEPLVARTGQTFVPPFWMKNPIDTGARMLKYELSNSRFWCE